jgi:phosphoglycerol transferase MdoB-like AlkP superfamily enzyme
MSQFVYGGYGYFDNMNYFFSHNGYQIVDRSDDSQGCADPQPERMGRRG